MSQPNQSKPNPGSDTAIEQGCTCPVLDNGRGDDELGRIRGFYINAACPMHVNQLPSKERPNDPA